MKSTPACEVREGTGGKIVKTSPSTNGSMLQSTKWSRTLWRLRECVARSADHVGDVQQARRLRGDPTCLVLVVFVSHDGQREVFR